MLSVFVAVLWSTSNYFIASTKKHIANLLRRLNVVALMYSFDSMFHINLIYTRNVLALLLSFDWITFIECLYV